MELTASTRMPSTWYSSRNRQTEEIRNLEAASKKKDSEIEAAKKAEEEARKAQEEALRRQAEEAAGQSGESGSSSGSSSSGGSSSGSGSSGYASASSYAGSGSKGQQIASYACQFIGNPYVPGGTSLTDGADCSGFV